MNTAGVAGAGERRGIIDGSTGAGADRRSGGRVDIDRRTRYSRNREADLMAQHIIVVVATRFTI